MRTLVCGVVFVFALAAGPVAPAEFIHVPADHATIQGGIDAAIAGDVVVVSDGTYTGAGNKNLDFGGKVITVKSQFGPIDCVIDCEGDGRGFIFQNGESRDAMLSGFTIRNGFQETGGAVACLGTASPTITGCVLTMNEASGVDTGYGGAVYAAADAAPVISNNRFYDNLGVYGGAIHCSSTTLIVNNIIRHNNAMTGGAVFCDLGEDVRIDSCTIVSNTAAWVGGGVQTTASRLTVTDSILWGNDAPTGPQAGAVDYSLLLLRSSDVQGGLPDVYFSATSTIGWHGTSIVADPLFATGPLGDYYLAHQGTGHPADSPCVDAGGGPAYSVSFPTTSGTRRLNDMSTRNDRMDDIGDADMGYHYPGLNLVSAEMSASPTSGTLPFSYFLVIRMTNNHPSMTRRLAGNIHIHLAGGQNFQNWKRGQCNLQPAESYLIGRTQEFPYMDKLVGENVFQFFVEDVTPLPWNHPPRTPSWDTDTATVTVEGIAP